MLELDFSRFPVLVVDDEQDNLDAFRFAFRKSFALRYALGASEALTMLDELDPAVIVSDQRMPGMSGIELLRQAVHKRPDAVGVLLTAYTDLPVLLEAINSGAVHRYVQKPWDSKELSVILRQGIERFFTIRDNRRMREQLTRYAGYLETEHHDPIDFGELTSDSPAMRAAVARLEELAPLGAPILIAGESGTEKELFARAIHVGRGREARPFVRASGAGLAGEALERELFGWMRGAFDGAIVDRPGKLELADGGTLMLDGLCDPGVAIEARLVDWLGDATVTRIGASKSAKVDVQLVVTASQPADRIFANGDLQAALARASVTVPPLRERRHDLRSLSDRLLVKSAKKQGKPPPSWSDQAMARLLSYDWPGNVAELSAVIDRAVLLCDGSVVSVEHLPGLEPTDCDAAPVSSPSTSARLDLPSQLDEIERRELCAALERCGGNKAEVARMLGIQRTTLYYRLKRLEIEV